MALGLGAGIGSGLGLELGWCPWAEVPLGLGSGPWPLLVALCVGQGLAYGSGVQAWARVVAVGLVRGVWPRSWSWAGSRVFGIAIGLGLVSGSWVKARLWRWAHASSLGSRNGPWPSTAHGISQLLGSGCWLGACIRIMGPGLGFWRGPGFVPWAWARYFAHNLCLRLGLGSWAWLLGLGFGFGVGLEFGSRAWARAWIRFLALAQIPGTAVGPWGQATCSVLGMGHCLGPLFWSDRASVLC